MKIVPNKIIILLLVLLLQIAPCFAGPTPPVPTGKKPPGPPGLVPIDGGVYVLLLLALIYGFYKLYYRKKAS